MHTQEAQAQAARAEVLPPADLQCQEVHRHTTEVGQEAVTAAVHRRQPVRQATAAEVAEAIAEEALAEEAAAVEAEAAVALQAEEDRNH